MSYITVLGFHSQAGTPSRDKTPTYRDYVGRGKPRLAEKDPELSPGRFILQFVRLSDASNPTTRPLSLHGAYFLRLPNLRVGMGMEMGLGLSHPSGNTVPILDELHSQPLKLPIRI